MEELGRNATPNIVKYGRLTSDLKYYMKSLDRINTKVKKIKSQMKELEKKMGYKNGKKDKTTTW